MLSFSRFQIFKFLENFFPFLLKKKVNQIKMAVGKNKRLTKGGKKGQKKKIVDPFTRKEWYDVRAPVMFNTRGICKTPVNKTAGKR